MPTAPDASNRHIAVVLPSYNEAAHIADVVRSIPSWVQSVIVVDDASSDDTAELARAAGDSRVTVVSHTRNQGVGAATITGYKAALELGADVVVKMDGDGQMASEDLAQLVYPIVTGMGDYAKGNRFRFTAGKMRMPVLRKLGSIGLSFLTKISSGYWHVFDSQCGFTASSGNMLRLLDLDSIAQDYFFENDMLISLNALDARVIDVPVRTIYGSEVSHLSIGRVLLTFPARLAAAAIRRAVRKYFVLDFGAPGALVFSGVLMTLFGAAFGGYHWYLSKLTGVVASTGTVMVAVLPITVGLQLLVQAFVMEASNPPGAKETSEYARQLIAEGSPKW